MRIAESVTFGGAGLLDRAAHLRTDEHKVADLASFESARTLLVWRGKILMSAGKTVRSLALVAPDHPACRHADEDPVFLGLEGGAPRFALDISGWEPTETPESLGAFLDVSEQHLPELPASESFAELRANMARLSAADAELAVSAKAILGWHQTHKFCACCGEPTMIYQAGWQRKCPTCSALHFPRTDPVVIMLITHGNDLLLGRSPGWPDGMYSLLAGFAEPGETIEAAVRREVAEETKISVGPVRYLASQPWPFPSSLMIGCHGEATSRQITLDPVELDDAFWISRSELADVFAGTSHRIKAARKGSIAQFLMWNWLADRLN